jgi:hypothetical protein
MQQLSNKNWLERNEAITLLVDAIISNSGVLLSAGKLESMIEQIIEKFEDGSIKVIVIFSQALILYFIYLGVYSCNWILRKNSSKFARNTS